MANEQTLIEYAQGVPGSGGTYTKLFNAALVGGILWIVFAGGSGGRKDPFDPSSFEGLSSRRRRRRRRRK